MLITKQKTNIKVAVGLKDCKYMNIQYIYDLYAMATAKEKQTDWYLDAYTFSQNLANKYAYLGVNQVQVANLIAAISPQLRWENNKKNAEIALQAYDAVMNGWLERKDLPSIHKFSAISNNGYAVLFGERFTLGQKTASFAANILGDSQVVTVDSLAMSILLGFYEKAGTYKIYNGAYAYAQGLYIHAAKRLGITPAYCQAVVWTVCRRLKKSHRKVNKQTLVDIVAIVGQNPADVLKYIVG